MNVKCSSWLGHNYEARMDIGEPTIEEVTGRLALRLKELLEASAPKTYVRDICTRCGHCIERVQP